MELSDEAVFEALNVLRRFGVKQRDYDLLKLVDKTDARLMETFLNPNASSLID